MTVLEQSLKNRLNEGSNNEFPEMFRRVKLGNVMRAMNTHLWSKVPSAGGAANYQLATLQRIALPDDAKAESIVTAFSRSATAGSGRLVVALPDVTPGSGEIAVAPNGDLVVLAADAHLLVDVVYTPRKYDLLRVKLPVAVGLLTIPARFQALALLEAKITAGTTLGNSIILKPAAGLPATTKAQLNIAKSQVQFNNATDAPTEAEVLLAIVPDTDVDALLTAVSEF